MHYAILILSLLFAVACTDSTPSQPTVGGSSQALIDEEWCEAHPVACEHACPNENVPFCQGATPECVDLGGSCVDEEEPNYVPCCGFAEGLADCFLDPETNTRSCEAITQCEGPVMNQECDPNGTPCCPSTNPNDPPVTCEASDPSDPETLYVCTPGA